MPIVNNDHEALFDFELILALPEISNGVANPIVPPDDYGTLCSLPRTSTEHTKRALSETYLNDFLLRWLFGRF